MPGETTTYKTGDVVQLKSGGPVMTVIGETGFSDSPLVNCAYFVDNDRLVTVELPFEALVVPEAYR